MRFDSQNEYYETLGFLAKSDGSIGLMWEDNQVQGAWGSEGRIHCYSNLIKFTPPLKRKFTKGRAKKVLHRINCNDFVADLISTHNFSMGSVQNTANIRMTIPQPYLIDFDRGLHL
ncbi:hypothetical protein IWX84_003117 [Flavobacterium sp. CG_9.10]|nr:hypothetical protein [Flavobacterium sp. CG_9.10]